MNSKIELLSTDILINMKNYVNQFRHLSEDLDKELGWHYLLDLAWSVNHLPPFPNKLILDAGAGDGIMQWWLAEQGADVISVDKLSRFRIADKYRNRYKIKGWCRKDLSPILSIRDILPSRKISRLHLYPSKLINTSKKLIFSLNSKKKGGTIFLHNCDISNMINIPDETVDEIVSISSLEHNSPKDLYKIINELMRVLKPGGRIVATLGASKEKDWFHKPSRGWCFTEKTLKNIFDLPINSESNFEQYDEYFQRIIECIELRDNLAGFYFRSNENGMPWGVWDPMYLPVGVVKYKQ